MEAPAPASATAIASPNPRLPPVMSAVRPVQIDFHVGFSRAPRVKNIQQAAAANDAPTIR